jgi:hypothetical protein
VAVVRVVRLGEAGEVVRCVACGKPGWVAALELPDALGVGDRVLAYCVEDAAALVWDALQLPRGGPATEALRQLGLMVRRELVRLGGRP